MKNLWIGLVILVVIVAGYFVLGQKPKEVTGEPIKIGGLFALSSYAAFAGETSRNGFIMALEDAGLNPSQYPIEDFHSDLTTTASAAKKLSEIDGVKVVLGPEWAEFSQVVVPIATTDHTVFISPWMTGEGESFQSPYYFSMTPSERGQVRAVLAYMVKHSLNKIALISSNNAWSIGLEAIIKDEITHDYPSVTIVFESNPPQDSTDYRTDLLKIKTLGVDAIYALMATSQTGEAFVNQYKQLASKAPLFMPTSAVTSISADTAARTNLNGIFYPSWQDYSRTAEFNQKYKKRFGVEPAAITGATTYDATTLVLQAIKSGAQTSEQVIAYLKAIKKYSGYSGVISFDETNHVVTQAVELRQVSSSSYVVVE
ncbi:ABC transporter substrate-binding protein [Candidatus Kaiserbacteria bacterium]|nr:ABC transporter substrate-binding protein [Candidatus Kaiserbacteria bacterium]